MKETILRYLIVAAIGAFIASLASCGTSPKYAKGYSKKAEPSPWPTCAAYQ